MPQLEVRQFQPDDSDEYEMEKKLLYVIKNPSVNPLQLQFMREYYDIDAHRGMEEPSDCKK